MSKISKLYGKLTDASRRVWVKKDYVFQNNANLATAATGVAILTLGLSDLSQAQAVMNDQQIVCAVHQLLALTEGNFGALVMTVAGLGTIISSAFGAFRAATSMLVVAMAAFILKSFIYIFFDVSTTVMAGCALPPSYIP